MTFNAHRQLVDALLNKYLEDPMPDFLPVTWPQLRAADEYVFTRLAEITYAGKKEDPLQRRVAQNFAQPSV
eukprot:1497542-Amphidinium_carterae.1